MSKSPEEISKEEGWIDNFIDIIKLSERARKEGWHSVEYQSRDHAFFMGNYDEEVKEWCKQHDFNGQYYISGRIITFEKEADAVYFKLTYQLPPSKLYDRLR